MDNRDHSGSTPTDDETRPATVDGAPPDGDPETLAEALAAHDAVLDASADAVAEASPEAVADASADVGADASTEAAMDASADMGADASSEAVADGPAEPGADVPADAGVAALSQAVADARAEAGPDASAEAGAFTEAIAEISVDPGADAAAHAVADAPADAAATDTPEPPTLDDVVPDASEELSPAVRRLVRQYDVDVRKIQGSGPSGRIRVSDVMAYLGGRTYAPPEQPEPPRGNRAPAQGEERPPAAKPLRESAQAHARGEPEPVTLAPVTTVFECDLGAVLAHRKQLRQRNVDVVLTSYFLVAASEALRAVPEAAEGHEPVRIGAVLTFADGGIQTAMVDAPDGSAFESLPDRLLAVDKEFRFSARSAELNPRLIDLLVHHHGASGSVVATPTPIGEGHTASIGVGKVRREIVVGGGEDDAAPRIAARCYVSLSFYPDRLELARANRFMAQLVRVLEQWPAA